MGAIAITRGREMEAKHSASCRGQTPTAARTATDEMGPRALLRAALVVAATWMTSATSATEPSSHWRPLNPSSELAFLVSSRLNVSGHRTLQAQIHKSLMMTQWDFEADVFFDSYEKNGTATRLLKVSFTGGAERRSSGFVQLAGGGLYKAQVRAASWLQAVLVCERLGSHLAVPNSLQEARVLGSHIASLARNFSGHSSTDYFHVGYSDIAVEGTFVDVLLGEPLEPWGRDAWGARQPDGKTTQNCMALHANGTLHDVFCDSTLPFACEVPA